MVQGECFNQKGETKFLQVFKTKQTFLLKVQEESQKRSRGFPQICTGCTMADHLLEQLLSVRGGHGPGRAVSFSKVWAGAAGSDGELPN